MVKVVTVVGPRPQFIKASAVSRIMRQESSLQEVMVHTGQHYDENMSDVFFRELEIPNPQFHLGVGSCSPGKMVGRMTEKIEEILTIEKPDWMLVYGDTNSTLAGALAAVKSNISVAHVEAGLRSFNRSMPEEMNRILTDQCSQLLFAPTEGAQQQLQKEGFDEKNICLCGDVMVDMALRYKKKALEYSINQKMKLQDKKYALATVHRAGNTDDRERLETIFLALIQVADKMPVVVPLHPRTRKKLSEAGLLGHIEDRLILLNPVGYFEMIALESSAKVILTDSGGVQKESYFVGTPCLVLREETEWTELVDIGHSRLVGASTEKILEGVTQCGNSTAEWTGSLYGNGQAAEMIVKKLCES